MHIILRFQTHLKDLEIRKKKIKQLSRKAAMKAEKNAVLDQQIHDMQVTVAEMRHIYQAAGNKTVILIPMQRSKVLFFF